MVAVARDAQYREYQHPERQPTDQHLPSQGKQPPLTGHEHPPRATAMNGEPMELPEYEVIRRDLEREAGGKKIASIAVHRPKLLVETTEKELTEGTEGIKVSNVEPVSYTHLDVYKRQTSGCSPRGSPRPRRAPSTSRCGRAGRGVRWRRIA